jgi:hypothetical protein
MTREIWRNAGNDERYMVELSPEGELVKAAKLDGGGDPERLLRVTFPPEPAARRLLADRRAEFVVDYELDAEGHLWDFHVG